MTRLEKKIKDNQRKMSKILEGGKISSQLEFDRLMRETKKLQWWLEEVPEPES